MEILLCGTEIRALQESVLDLHFALKRGWPVPEGVDRTRLAWLCTGFHRLLQSLLAQQPPEGPFTSHVEASLRSFSTLLGSARADDPAGEAFVRRALGKVALVDSFLRDPNVRSLGDLLDDAVVASHVAKLKAEASACRVQRVDPGSRGLLRALESGQTRVDGLEQFWARYRNARGPGQITVKNALVRNHYLFELPRTTLLGILSDPVTWRGLDGGTLDILARAMAPLCRIMSADQREEVSRVAGSLPPGTRSREALFAALEIGARVRQEPSLVEVLLAGPASVGSARVVALVGRLKEESKDRLFWADCSASDVDQDTFLTVNRTLDALIARMQKDVAERWKSDAPGSIDLWSESCFVLAWVLGMVWMQVFERAEASIATA